LGWTLNLPYRRGGSSRHLTIASVCVPSHKSHIPKRIVRKLYQQYSWPTATERKWVDMPSEARTDFARAAVTMCNNNPDISIHAITVKKENVQGHPYLELGAGPTGGCPSHRSHRWSKSADCFGAPGTNADCIGRPRQNCQDLGPRTSEARICGSDRSYEGSDSLGASDLPRKKGDSLWKQRQDRPPLGSP
jgi:hypothetical protein